MIDPAEVKAAVQIAVYTLCAKNEDGRAAAVAAVLALARERLGLHSVTIDGEHALLDALHAGYRSGLWSWGASLRYPGEEWLHVATPKGTAAMAAWRRRQHR